MERWLAASPGDDDQRLRTLERFLSERGQSADELIDGLFRSTEVGPRIRLKQRREVMNQIDAWEVENGRDAGNVVRSFLVHNGISLTATPIW